MLSGSKTERLIKVISKYPLIVITAVILVANWQLLFGLTAIKWDSANYWHPWRYFISECYNNGIVPVWNPYTQSGYPIHGDLQGPAYSIDAIVTSFLFKGSLYSINLVFLSYLIFGAYGFYKLSLFISGTVKNPVSNTGVYKYSAALIIGIVYSLSGFVTAHGHNLYIVVSVGLLPWLYYYFFRILEGGTFYDAVKFAIVLMFQVTAGNPSFLIVSVYFFTVAFVVRLLHKLRNKDYVWIKAVFKKFSLAFLLSLVLCAPVILNAALIFKDTTRGGGVSLDWAGLENSPVQGLFSFFTPLCGFENTIDFSVRQPILNYYVGLFTLFFVIIGFTRYKSFYLRLLAGLAIVAFFLSLGLETPLFGILHKYLPFFNVFRMPKLLFIYDVFYLLILSALGIQYFFSRRENYKKYFIVYGVTVLLVIAGSVLYFGLFYKDTPGTGVNYSSVISWFRSSTQLQRTFLSAIVSLTMLILFYLIIRTKRLWLLPVILLAEVIAVYNFTAINRIFDEVPLSFKNAYINELPKGFPVPQNISPADAFYLSGKLQSFWLNSSIYFKQPDFTSNNSFALANHAFLEDERKEAFKYVIGKPLAFLVDSVCTEIKGNEPDGKNIVVATGNNLSFSYKRTVRDTIECKTFLPGKMEYKVRSGFPAAFCVQQAYNRFWHIYVNGKEIKPAIAFYNFPLITLPAGINEIRFEYKVPFFNTVFILSLLTFIILILVLIWQKKKFAFLFSAIVVVVVLYCVVSFYGSANAESINEKDSPGKLIVQNKNQNGTFNFLYPDDVAAFMATLPSIGTDSLLIFSEGTFFPQELHAVVSADYGVLSSRKNGARLYLRKRNSEWKKVYTAVQTDTALSAGIRVNKKAEFAGGLKSKCGEINLRMSDLVVAEAEIESDFTDFIGLCLSVNTADQKNKRFGASRSVRKTVKGKRYICLFYTVTEEVDPTDELSVFFWNNDERSILLKSLRYSVYRKN